MLGLNRAKPGQDVELASQRTDGKTTVNPVTKTDAPEGAASANTHSSSGLDFRDRRTTLARVQGVLHRYPAFSPAVVLLAAVVVFGLLNDRFLLPSNLSLISQQVAVVGALAVAQTLVILTAGIDLSVGAAMVLASMAIGQSAFQSGLPGPLALLVGLMVGLGAGALNGFLVTKLKLPPFIVTLGTLNIFAAFTLLYSRGASVNGSLILAF